jgi:hypothetical protein
VLRLLLPVIAALSLGSSAAAQPVRVEDFTRSTSDDGITTIKDPVAPISFKLPPGWRLSGGSRWGNYETTLILTEAESGTSASLYYQYPLETARSSDADIALQGFMQSKVRQRRDREGLKDYEIRQNTVRRRTIAGRPALSFYAAYTTVDENRVPMTEYVARLMGESIKAHCFVAAPSAVDITPFVKRLDAVMESLDIPEFPTR